MAVENRFVDGFLRFEHQISWVELAREEFLTLHILRNETRLSDNMSPFLGIYAIGYYEGGNLNLIPLFSNEGFSGLIVTFKGTSDVKNMINTLSRQYGSRFCLEEPNYEWPDDAEKIFAPFDENGTILLDGVINNRPGAPR